MKRPSVLIVHNRYQERGGEDSVFEAEAALLEAHGHSVSRLVFDNSDLPAQPTARERVALAAQTVWSSAGRERLRGALQLAEPEVVHFHNTLPQVSPAAYEVCHQAGAVVIQTLHNYRLVCPSGLLFRDGRPCDDCVGHAFAAPALLHACYRGSRAQTAAVASMLAVHRARGTYRRDVDLYISPSEFLKTKMVEGGLPAERILVKPNFIDPDPGPGNAGGDYALYVGRLAQEKGVETLLDAYSADSSLPPLHVVGDGPLGPAVRLAASIDSRITFRGRLDREGVLSEMSDARCLVFPSVWYENFPVTIVEAFARGLPIVGSNLGAIPDLVSENETGLLFAAASSADLARKLTRLWSDSDLVTRLGRSARETYLARFTGQHNYEELIAAYYLALGRVPALA